MKPEEATDKEEIGELWETVRDSIEMRTERLGKTIMKAPALEEEGKAEQAEEEEKRKETEEMVKIMEEEMNELKERITKHDECVRKEVGKRKSLWKEVEEMKEQIEEITKQMEVSEWEGEKLTTLQAGEMVKLEKGIKKTKKRSQQQNRKMRGIIRDMLAIIREQNENLKDQYEVIRELERTSGRYTKYGSIAEECLKRQRQYTILWSKDEDSKEKGKMTCDKSIKEVKKQGTDVETHNGKRVKEDIEENADGKNTYLMGTPGELSTKESEEEERTPRGNNQGRRRNSISTPEKNTEKKSVIQNPKTDSDSDKEGFKKSCEERLSRRGTNIKKEHQDDDQGIKDDSDSDDEQFKKKCENRKQKMEKNWDETKGKEEYKEYWIGTPKREGKQREKEWEEYDLHEEGENVGKSKETGSYQGTKTKYGNRNPDGIHKKKKRKKLILCRW